MTKLTEKQLKEIKKELVRDGVPVRFLLNGENLDIVSGRTLPKGTNVMYQTVYWNFSKETIAKIVKWLGVKAEMSPTGNFKSAILYRGSVYLEV